MLVKRIVRRRVPAGADWGDLHPVLQRVYAARAVKSPADLDRSLEGLARVECLRGVQQAVAVLEAAVVGGRRILVVGDFDADGATSCALAVRLLRDLGASWVHYLVPNRFEYGYGLTPEIVEVAAQWSPDVIVTVDNGISSVEGVSAARERGMQVVVTDHHLPGSVLPGADAIVNPNQPHDTFPSKHLAGVGVIFYVLLALRARLRDTDWFQRRIVEVPNLADRLDLVALGTVADVVPLDHNNRILVEQGLRRIRAGRCCPGILALLEVANRSPRRLVAADLGFAVGPRLNAAGRLEDMSLGIECLLTDDAARARELAVKLDALNRERREIESQMREQAMAEIERLHLDPDSAGLPTALCLFDESWHQGVIGIVASRVKERLHRPVIAFAPAGDGEIKGSARSIPGLHVRDALDAVATRHPGLINKFGGHAMAAGLSLKRGDLDAFRDAFEQEVRSHLDDADLEGVVHSDGELAVGELGLELAQVLRAGGPWGQGFPEPVFDGVFEVLDERVVGEKHLKLVVRPLGGDIALDAIAFNALEHGWPTGAARLRLAYRLDVNEFRGNSSPQLVVEYMEAGNVA
ncbi:MAG: single-stranded-DNA-specific exonuclease RecJ [Gammaproteobacteria bacterium]